MTGPRKGQTTAQPYVSGKRIMIAKHSMSHGGPSLLGAFSCHWAAVVALVRLHEPDFEPTGGIKLGDLDAEGEVRASLKALHDPAPMCQYNERCPWRLSAEGGQVCRRCGATTERMP